MAGAQRDIWSRWLLERRFGGDPQQRRVMLDYLLAVRDGVLDLAHLGEGEILLDVGCGDGFIGFGALEKVKGSQWQAFLHTAPNPKAPTLEEAISQALTPTEAGRLMTHLRPLVGTGNGIVRSAVAYLWATKILSRNLGAIMDEVRAV